MGTVSSINGNIITITAKNNNIYTVDTSTAKIIKNRNTIITISGIKVGDTLTVNSTDIKATPIIATTIFDGKPIKPIKKVTSNKSVVNKTNTINKTTN